jgi:GTPase SAR1 family protein
MQFSAGEFPTQYIPTIFDNYSANMMVTNTEGVKKPVQLGLWDFTHREDSANLRPLSYPQTHVAILCYCAVVYPKQRSSLKSIEEVVRQISILFVSLRLVSNCLILILQWYPEISKWMPDVPIILLRTKSDLETAQAQDGAAGPRSQWEDMPSKKYDDSVEVPWEDAERLAQKMGAVAHLRCSAFQNTGVQEAFHAAAAAALEYRLSHKSGSPPIIGPFRESQDSPWVYKFEEPRDKHRCLLS